MRQWKTLFLWILIGIGLFGCNKNDQTNHLGGSSKTPLLDATGERETIELNISAAASLKDCLTDIQILYEKTHLNTKIFINYGGSGILQQQIEQGAPADVFISAGEKQVDALETANLLLDGTREDLLTNEVVMIAPKDSTVTDIQQCATDMVKTIAQGDSKVVPMRQYAIEVLDYYQLTEKVADKVVYGKDVKEVLSWVETGNADVGFVFKTDALISDKVKVIQQAPPESHTPVTYPLGIINTTKQEAEAKQFVAFLRSPEAVGVFEKYGFGMADTTKG